MKRTLLTMGSVLTLSGVLFGCQPDNAAYDKNRDGMRNVTFRTADQNDRNFTNDPGTPDNVNNNMAQDRSQGRPGYGQERRLAQRIAQRADAVPGVDRAHAIVSRNNVAVGVVPENAGTNNEDVEKKVRAAIKPITGDRRVYVTSDTRYVNRITTAETNFNAGRRGMREAGADITGIIDDLANALKRPFENNDR
ncbi:YhcN/YlaJ family sporulation lipoprotein [Sporolactobacillus sp. Y61]|uniref:YhcN/YlaJ family sporulation lipoprotein n=1 Tax=Sporolactobacillus sp. Y61 TaxID=3160863 RepID=A0AAU8IE65_9BACL